MWVQPKEKPSSKYDESRGAEGGAEEGGDALADPVAEKLRQQRLVEEADYKATLELFGGGGRLVVVGGWWQGCVYGEGGGGERVAGSGVEEAGCTDPLGGGGRTRLDVWGARKRGWGGLAEEVCRMPGVGWAGERWVARGAWVMWHMVTWRMVAQPAHGGGRQNARLDLFVGGAGGGGRCSW